MAPKESAKNVAKAAPKHKQRSTIPSDRNGRRGLMGDERRNEKRNDAQRRYRERRALKAKQDKEEAERRIKSLIGRKPERRMISQYNMENVRLILKVGAMPS